MAYKIKKKYRELLEQGKEEREKSLTPLRVNETKLELSLRLGKMDLEIAQAEVECEMLASQYPLNITELVKSRNNLRMKDLERTNLRETFEELFGDEGEKS